MSYVFSFNIAPPTGFSINGSTGLITIAATAAPFTGNLSVKVFDGVTTNIKAIPIALTAPIISPLLSAVSHAYHRGGGRAVPVDIYFEPIVFRGGSSRMVPSIILATTRSAIARGGQSRTIGAIQIVSTIEAISRGGQSRTIGAIQFVPPSGFVAIARGGQSRTIGSIRVMAISIQQGASLTVAAGDSTTLNAQITAGGSTAGVSQSVTWSIVPGTYSGYGSISSAGVLTVTNGAYQATGAMITVRATSVSDPILTTTINIYAIDKFTGIQVTPSVPTVAAGDIVTINSLLQGIGSDLNGSHASLISVAISQANTTSTVTLSGNSVTYTASSTAGTININATFFYPAGNYQVQGSATVENTGSPATVGFTPVPSYTVISTGEYNYASLDWTSLNDGNWNTGVAIEHFSAPANCSIVIDLGSAKLIKRIEIAGGFLGGAWNDNIAFYLNDGFLEYSSDGVTWTTHATISGVVDTTGVYKQYNPNTTARYWRIRRTRWCVTSAFILYT